MMHSTAQTAHTSTSRQPEIRQMWERGPLRHWSQFKSTQAPQGFSVGFVGSYVCTECCESCEGVYRLREPHKWVCAPCKRKLQPSGGERQ
jgi:hypothetical protein